MLQPLIYDANGTPRFKQNKIIDELICGKSYNDFYLDKIFYFRHDNGNTQNFIDEHRHIYQMIGYSLSGYGDLQIVCEDGTYNTDTGEHLLMVDNAKVYDYDIDHNICDIVYVDGIYSFVGNETIKWVVKERGVDVNNIINDPSYSLIDKRQFLQLLGLSFSVYFNYSINRLIQYDDGYNINVNDLPHYNDLITHYLNQGE